MDRSPKGSGFRNWTAAAVLGIALAGGGYLIGLDSRPVPAPRPEPEAIANEAEAEPVPDAVLGRAGLIRIAAAAADRFGGGANVPQAVAGRRFQVRVAFGCGPPAEGGEPTGWTYDEGSKTLRIRVTPTEWTVADWLAAAPPGGAVDAVEGFWLPRPWTSSEQCPAGEVGVQPQTDSSIAIAHFFAAESDRSEQRRGRPFEVVSKIEPEAVPKNGLQLLLEGRVANVPGSKTTALCRGVSRAVRPTCLIAVEFERIAVVDPTSEAELATWRP